MAKIRHIAIKVEDQEKTAEFYKKTFGMTEAWRGPVRDDGNRAIYLTDGYINMAVLPARGGREGIDHFGFQVENMEETLKTAQAAGARSEADKKPRDGVSPKWACTIPQANWSMSRCMGGSRRTGRQ
jgi:catechol 2,3-dioxygenase-like lactoylglutathione lyase family enzyme